MSVEQWVEWLHLLVEKYKLYQTGPLDCFTRDLLPAGSGGGPLYLVVRERRRPGANIVHVDLEGPLGSEDCVTIVCTRYLREVEAVVTAAIELGERVKAAQGLSRGKITHDNVYYS
jgi:hypothetical protein